jgi:hypothetical protein
MCLELPGNFMSERPLPIVVNLGKQSSKRIKELERGEGKLVSEVQDTLAGIRASLGEQAASKELVPVVLVYKKKLKNGGRLKLPFL